VIFCKRCGTYSTKGTFVCPRCQSDLAAFGHESLSGVAISPRVSEPASTEPEIFAVDAPVYSQYGGFLRRLLAMIIDGLILTAGNTVVLLLAFLVFLGTAFPNLTQLKAAFGFLSIATLILAFAPIVYEIVLLAKRGATLGKGCLKLSVVRTNGEPVSAGRAAVRTAIKMFLSGFFLIGYLMALFTSKSQALHDLIADTVVVRVD